MGYMSFQLVSETPISSDESECVNNSGHRAGAGLWVATVAGDSDNRCVAEPEPSGPAHAVATDSLPSSTKIWAEFCRESGFSCFGLVEDVSITEDDMEHCSVFQQYFQPHRSFLQNIILYCIVDEGLISVKIVEKFLELHIVEIL
jgi:hypothetical protein